MPHKAKIIENIIRLTVLLLFLQLPSANAQAQKTMHLDSLNVLKYPVMLDLSLAMPFSSLCMRVSKKSKKRTLDRLLVKPYSLL